MQFFVALCAVTAAITWLVLAIYVMAVQRGRRSAERPLAEALRILETHSVRDLSVAERTARVRALLDETSRDVMTLVAADPRTPPELFDLLGGYLVERWTGRLEADAAAHHSRAGKIRRITALRILFRLNHPSIVGLLGRAIEDDDTELADAGLTLLGRSTDERAMDLLLDALKRQQHPGALVASHIEHSPLSIADRLRTLLSDTEPIVRFWAATLLARYQDAGMEFDLSVLTEDTDARVRKAAIQTLGVIGDDLAADCASRLLTDSQPFVRAHAARALGALERTDRASQVALLLGDADFWTRLAARESLEAMGVDVWPVLVRCLDDRDGFVRNGAAEVIQNLGVLDSLVVMEAASDHPAPAKIALLRRIASAGGMRFTDSLIERAGPRIGARIEALLATMGLEHVSV